MASDAVTSGFEKPVPVDQVESIPTHEATTSISAGEDDDGFNVATEAVGTDNLPPGYFWSPSFIGSFIAVSLLNVSFYVGYTLPVNVLSIINADIGPDSNIVLVPILKTLCQSVLVLLVGRLGDIFGRRWFIIVGQLLALIGSILGVTATSINMLMGATVFIGLSGAIQLTFTFIIQELVPNKHRGLVVALMFIVSFPFGTFGPVMARSLVQHTSLGWRWCYIMNIIASGVSLTLFFFCYHPPSYGLLHQGRTMRSELKKLDYLGVALYAGGLIMLLLGLSWGGSVHPWNSSLVIGTLVGGFATLIIFGFYEVYMPFKGVHPLVPIHHIKNRNFVALCVTGSVASMFYYSMNVIWPNMVTALFTSDVLTVGWYSIALGGSVAFGEIIAGMTMRPFGKPLKPHWQLRGACIGMCAFGAALASVTVDGKNTAIALMTLASFSLGYVELMGLVLVPFTVGPNDIGMASGFQACFRGTMGTIATGIYSTVLANRNLANIPSKVRDAATAAGLPASSIPAAIQAAEAGTAAAYAKVVGLTPAIKAAIMQAVKAANVLSYRTMFLVSLAFGVSAIIASFFVMDVDKHLSDDVTRKLQNFKGSSKKVDEEKTVRMEE